MFELPGGNSSPRWLFRGKNLLRQSGTPYKTIGSNFSIRLSGSITFMESAKESKAPINKTHVLKSRRNMFSFIFKHVYFIFTLHREK